MELAPLRRRWVVLSALHSALQRSGKLAEDMLNLLRMAPARLGQRALLTPRNSALSRAALTTTQLLTQPTMTPQPLASQLGVSMTRALSSSTAGLERVGLPRLERDSRGQAQGVQKGGKGRKSLGGVLAIKNTWNNTLISISDSSYKQLGFVSGGAPPSLVRASLCCCCRSRHAPRAANSDTRSHPPSPQARSVSRSQSARRSLRPRRRSARPSSRPSRWASAA